MVEMVERYLSDERLQLAYLGQGVIGTNASPHDSGTASIYFHHASGRMDGMAGTWGYVQGGMGMISFILCDIARDAGAVVATGVPVSRIVPGEGVELESGERIAASQVISNADPRTTLRLLGDSAETSWARQVLSVPMESVTVKVNMTLAELPNFSARPGLDEPHHTAQVNTPLSKEEWRAHHRAANEGELPPRTWNELYLQTVFDRSVAPAGMHTLSVFAQYVPHRFKEGSWETRRMDAGQVVVDSIARFCSNLPRAILAMDVLGPPDVERRVGLTGGQIFQGEILPEYMWDRRLSARTPMPGVYLCGAGTHPGGSVIGINGRNAAMEALRGSAPPSQRPYEVVQHEKLLVENHALPLAAELREQLAQPPPPGHVEAKGLREIFLRMLRCVGAHEVARRNRHIPPLEVDPTVVHPAVGLVHFSEGVPEAAGLGPVPVMIQKAVPELVGDETHEHRPRNLVAPALAHDVALLDLDDLGVAGIHARHPGTQQHPVSPVPNA